MKNRLTYGTRAACALCAQDIEWRGRAHGWLNRGGNRSCAPYQEKGEIATPPKIAKHKPQLSPGD